MHRLPAVLTSLAGLPQCARRPSRRSRPSVGAGTPSATWHSCTPTPVGRPTSRATSSCTSLRPSRGCSAATSRPDAPARSKGGQRGHGGAHARSDRETASRTRCGTRVTVRLPTARTTARSARGSGSLGRAVVAGDRALWPQAVDERPSYVSAKPVCIVSKYTSPGGAMVVLFEGEGGRKDSRGGTSS